MKPRTGPRLLRWRTRWLHCLRIRPDCCHLDDEPKVNRARWCAWQPLHLLLNLDPSRRSSSPTALSSTGPSTSPPYLAMEQRDGEQWQDASLKRYLGAWFFRWHRLSAFSVTSLGPVSSWHEPKQAHWGTQLWSPAPPTRLHLVSYIRSSYLIPQITQKIPQINSNYIFTLST